MVGRASGNKGRPLGRVSSLTLDVADLAGTEFSSLGWYVFD